MVFAGWLALETVLVALVKLASAPVDTAAEVVPPSEKLPEARAVELLADIPP